MAAMRMQTRVSGFPAFRLSGFPRMVGLIWRGGGRGGVVEELEVEVRV